jgi:hypothetical protein
VVTGSGIDAAEGATDGSETPGDCEGCAKKGVACRPAGLIGEVAIGEKKTGSTRGFVVAVYSAVKNLRTPAGLGMTMISGFLSFFEVVIA